MVDDDVGISEVLVEIFCQEGYQTTTAQTGKEAIEMFQREQFDVALIDIKLPDMDGTQLLGLLKKLAPTTIAIILTGYPSLDNAVQSLNLGADGYIVKPFKSLKLVGQIREQLERRLVSKWEGLLRNTGLSIYEAKIYLSLTLGGSAEVRKLSMSSGVPRTKAYTALKKLMQRGLVIEVPGATQKFSIADPTSAFNTFVQNWKKELSERATILSEFESAISMMESIHARKLNAQQINLQKEDVWSITSQQEIKQRIGEMLSQAKTSVCVMTTETGLVFFCKSFGKELDDLAEKGIKILIKTPVGPSNRSFVNDLRAAYKVEDMSVSIPIFQMTVDHKELFLHCLKKDSCENAEDKAVGLFSSSENLSYFFSKLLEVSIQR